MIYIIKVYLRRVKFIFEFEILFSITETNFTI